MKAYERRMAIWLTLCRLGKVTTAALSKEFGVSSRTIRTDIDILSRAFPIVTTMGRNGCITLADWNKRSKALLSSTELDLLFRLKQTLADNDALTMSIIIAKVTGYTPYP